MSRPSLRNLSAEISKKLGFRLERTVIADKPRIDVFELALHHVNLVKGKEFFFLQVGANDGVRVDPIRRYVKEYHWRGILVEPQPKVFESLKENYRDEPQLIFENVAIAEENGSLSLFCLDESIDIPAATGWASFDAKHVRRLLKPDTPVQEIQVPAVTVGTLLSKHGVGSVDLLQVDTEGYDYKVIKSFLETGIMPAVIRFEYPLLSQSDLEECLSSLADRRYAFWRDQVDIVAYRDPLPGSSLR
jgi:FkbM family methyltransferase